jgi:LuxR family maltose regulon positive regulatory protein
MQSLRSSAALLRGVHGFEGLSVMRQSARLATELEKDPASPWYALARVGLGFSLYLCGEPAAAAALEEAVVCESPLLLIRMMALSGLGLVAAGQGRLLWAEELVHAAGELAGRDDLGGTPQVAVAHMAAGGLLAAQGKLHEARAELEHALRLRRRVPGSSPWPTLETLLLLAEVLLELGDPGAADLLAEAQELLASLPDGADVQLARVSRLRQGLAGLSRAALLEPLTEREATVLRLLRGRSPPRDRTGAAPFAEYDQDPHPRDLPQARREQPGPGRRAGPPGRHLLTCRQPPQVHPGATRGG